MKTLRQLTHKEERFILPRGSRELCWLFSITAKIIKEKGPSVGTLKKCLHNSTLQARLYDIFLISDWRVWAQSMVGGATPRLVLDSMRKQTEQTMESQPVSSTPPRSLHPVYYTHLTMPKNSRV